MNSSFFRAIQLIVSGNSEVYFIAFTSLKFAFSSTVIATLISLPLGMILAFKHFTGKAIVVVVLNSLMALPTVVIGLILYSLLSRSGPLGGFRLLFTPVAIVMGQSILALPIVASLVYSAFSGISKELPETLETLGARGFSRNLMIMRESGTAVLSAVLSGFGRVIGEVGVSMMLGGNIRWYTRTITTTIALETSKGEFELALALGLILIAISFLVNFSLHMGMRYAE